MTISSELETMIQKLKLKTPFRGVMMKDELRNMKPLDRECGIINLNSSDVSDEVNKKTGHWIAYYRRPETVAIISVVMVVRLLMIW